MPGFVSAYSFLYIDLPLFLLNVNLIRDADGEFRAKRMGNVDAYAAVVYHWALVHFFSFLV